MATTLLAGFGLVAIAGLEMPAAAQTTVTRHDTKDAHGDIVVVARTQDNGTAPLAASAGGLDGATLARRPILRTSELAEAVPGMIAVQHSGGGKAAQYMIRGYNLDHGTDFSIAIDGMPFNLRSHAHGHGYLDLNGLIPETVARIDYRKGPYRAADGDFSAVAAASLRTLDRFDRPFAEVEGGSYGYRRFVAGASAPVGAGTLLVATEVKANDGVWQLPERLRHVSGFGKYSVETGAGTLRASLSVYDARWRPTEQVPVRAIGTLLRDRFATLDPFLRGTTSRGVLTMGLEGDGLDVTAYAQRYRFDLLSNFTFFLADPVNGDEIEQTESRWTVGARAVRRIALRDRLALTAGVEGRSDRIDDLGLYQTRAGRRIATASLTDARETSIGGYVELDWKPVPRLRLVGGGRIDHSRFATIARAGKATSGAVTASIATPKASATIDVMRGWTVHAGYGQGFHSNAVRGITAAVDPTPAFARATGYEIGTRFARGTLVMTLDRWWSRSASELVYSGDDGTVSPTGPSRRRGYEATIDWRPVPALAIDAVVATNHARFVDAPGQDRIPNALESAGSIGVTGIVGAVTAGVRLRHIGARPLVEDNSVRGAATTVVNLRLGWTLRQIELRADLLNLFDTARADADYFYASRLPGEPIDGVEGVHSRAVEPRMLRIGARVAL